MSAMWGGFAYTAFVVDAFTADRGLEGVGLAGDRSGLGRFGDGDLVPAGPGPRWAGAPLGSGPSQYTAIRYSARLEEAGIVPSVGSRGDSYDNALAETINGLYKAELIRRRGPWRRVAEVEAATAEWVAWWNHQRLHGSCDRLPPAEYEACWYDGHRGAA